MYYASLEKPTLKFGQQATNIIQLYWPCTSFANDVCYGLVESSHYLLATQIV